MASVDILRAPRLPVTRALALFVLAGAVAFAAVSAEAKKPKKRDADAEITDYSDEALSKRFQLPLSEIGYLVVDAKTGKVLEERQPKEPFVPASTIKVASSVAALVVLGADHRFQTDLVATGVISNGTLVGDLFLKGGGDPMLTSDEFESMAQQLKAKGVTKVSGRFLYDFAAYTSVKAIDAEYEESASYNPGIAALSVNFNLLQLKWEREKKGGAARFRFSAQTDNHELDVDYLKAEQAQPGTTGPYGLAYRDDPKSPTWMVLPGKRPKGEIRVPVKQPDFNASHIFKKAAEKYGIALSDPVPGAAPNSANLIVRQTSKPLPDIVHRTMRFSNNMAAELLALAAARKLSGKTLDPAASGQVLAAWYKAQIAGTDWGRIELRNGSGLSKDSRISPEQMVAILRYAQKLSIGNQIYADLLRPYNAGKGKVEADEEYGSDEGKREKHAKRGVVSIMAKTGTVNYSRGLVGYIHTAKGHDVIFAVFLSDYKQREVMQKQGQGWKEPPVRWWMSRSREFQRALVKRWAEKL